MYGLAANTAEVIDLNVSTPVDTNELQRKHLNAALLPDGKVIITGGTGGRLQHSCANEL